ncbi:hypothetical protein [Thermodesulfovibrio sp. TK110]
MIGCSIQHETGIYLKFQFEANEVNDIGEKIALLKQILTQYGKVFVAKDTVFLKPTPEYENQRKTLLKLVISEFYFLWEQANKKPEE